ncbi:type II toxin-antitoxin system RelB family antitoxin [Emergencia sp. 1XD21-10]|uniref:type II toxin-antitoxin system RelB family antitoxin n=1 Tax=Emergencia sp. 1XD21-10 TaxID=2304569 RepID=UPI00137ADE70|nr:antitoxin [Emergencia sp. 1XD21-10]
MSVISVRVTNDEMTMLENVSKLYGCGVSSMIKQIVFDKLEEEYDLQIIERYEKEKASGTLETRPIEALWEELEL